MKKFLNILVPVVLFMASCKDAPERPFNAAGVKCGLAPDQSGTMGRFVSHYLSLKDALVATDAAQANQSAISMQQEWQSFKVSFDSATIQPATQQRLFLELVSMKEDLNKIIIHNDKSCEPQRIYFKDLSDSLYAFVQNHETSDLHLYRYYCPMAMNGKGAWWFSASRKVKNPYFGSKMLTCGELVDTLR